MLASPPPELEALLERRRQAGVDRLDAVWQGVRHMLPGPSFEHARVSQQLAVLLDGPARDAGLLAAMGEFNLGVPRASTASRSRGGPQKPLSAPPRGRDQTAPGKHAGGRSRDRRR